MFAQAQPERLPRAGGGVVPENAYHRDLGCRLRLGTEGHAEDGEDENEAEREAPLNHLASCRSNSSGVKPTERHDVAGTGSPAGSVIDALNGPAYPVRPLCFAGLRGGG